MAHQPKSIITGSSLDQDDQHAFGQPNDPRRHREQKLRRPLCEINDEQQQRKRVDNGYNRSLAHHHISNKESARNHKQAKSDSNKPRKIITQSSLIMSQFASPNLSRDRITISGRSGRLGIFRKGKASRKTVVQGGDEFSEDAFLNQKAGSRLSEGRNDQQEAIVMSAYFTPQQSSLHKPFLPQSVENPSDDDSSRSYKARHPIHSSESRSFEALVNSEGGSKAKDCAISSHSSNDHEGPSDRSEPNLDRQTLSHRSLSLGLSIEALVGGSLETNNTIGGDHVEFPADSDAYQSLYYPTVSTVDPVMLSVQPQVETAPSCVHPQLPSNPIYYPSLYFMHEIPAEMVQTSQYNLPTAPNYRPEPYGYAYDILVDPYTTQRHHPDLYNEYLKEFEDVARESEDSGLNPSENSRSTPPSAQALFQWRPRRLF